MSQQLHSTVHLSDKCNFWTVEKVLPCSSKLMYMLVMCGKRTILILIFPDYLHGGPHPVQGFNVVSYLHMHLHEKMMHDISKLHFALAPSLMCFPKFSWWLFSGPAGLSYSHFLKCYSCLLNFCFRNSSGFVYLRFENVQSAASAQRSLHGRWFAGKMITATFMV